MERQRINKFLVILKRLGSGKVILRLSNFHSLSFKAINLILIEQEREYQREWNYKRYLAHNAWMISKSLGAPKNWKPFEDMWDKMNEVKEVEEEKSADEIIEGVLSKLRKRGEE